MPGIPRRYATRLMVRGGKLEPDRRSTGVVASGASMSGLYEPLTNGNLDDPELIFCQGDVVMVARKEIDDAAA